jgi:hypothetical protein
MKTPDWSQAPEWANYVAMDECGDWYWYSHQPTKGDVEWITLGKQKLASGREHWRDSLQSRNGGASTCTP